MKKEENNKLTLSEIVENLEMQSSELKYYFDKFENKFVFTIEDYNDDEENEKLLKAVEDRKRFAPLPSEYELNEYAMMEEFTTLQKEEIQNILFKCLTRKGVFRRFKDKLFDFDIREDWFTFKNEQLKVVASDWVVEEELMDRFEVEI